jgi:hypothetical protein
MGSCNVGGTTGDTIGIQGLLDTIDVTRCNLN